MNSSPVVRQLFLSAVSAEFGDHRRLLKADLNLPHVKVQEQDDFVSSGNKLLTSLDGYVKNCDAVICLVGERGGQTARAAELRWLRDEYPDFTTSFPFLKEDLEASSPSLTYTQLEAWLALFHAANSGNGRPRCHFYRPGSLTQSGNDRPVDPSQQRHWNHLRSLGSHYTVFDDSQHLCRRVLRDLHNLWPQDIPEAKCRLPYPPLGELFIGREAFLAELRERFDRARKRKQWPTQAVLGLGGVGKTRLAVEYAWQWRDDYTAVLMVNGESPQTLDRELAALAGILIINFDSAATDPERLRATHDWLDQHPGWLLIIDNVDTTEARDAVLSKLRDWARGHVLITGRVRSWPRGVEPLDLHVLDPAHATQFLLQATAGRRASHPNDEAQAHKLATDDLGCLCLALEQSAAYIGELRISFAEYRQRWAANKQGVHAWADKLLMHYREEQEVSLSIATTWQTTFDQLTLEAAVLLKMMSWLAPDPLPREIFGKCDAIVLKLSDFDEIREVLECKLAELRRFSLLTAADDAEFESLGQVHRLVQLITREHLSDTQRKVTLRMMLQVIREDLPNDCNDVGSWAVMEPLQPHLAAITRHADDATHHSHEEEILNPTVILLHKLGSFLYAKAAYAEAEPVMRRALAICEQLLGADDPILSNLLSNLALLLEATNRPVEAERLARRALTIVEKTMGPEDSEVAIKCNNLATLLQATSRSVEAEPLLRRALKISEKKFGLDHPDVSGYLNNLAVLLREESRLAEAEPLMRRALAIDEKSYGPNHPRIAVHCCNLSRLLVLDKRLGEAEPLARRAVEIDEQSLPPYHPQLAVKLGSLALMLQTAGRLSEAEPLMRRALSISEKSLGPEHPDVAIDLINLAGLLRGTNRSAEARSLINRSVEILRKSEKQTGHAHPAMPKVLAKQASLDRGFSLRLWLLSFIGWLVFYIAGMQAIYLLFRLVRLDRKLPLQSWQFSLLLVLILYLTAQALTLLYRRVRRWW